MPDSTRHAILLLLLTAAILFTAVAVSHSGPPAVAAAAEASLKLLAEPGILPQRPGIRLWHDYGSFGLYQVDPAVWADLPDALKERTTPVPQSDWLLLDARPFNTLDPAARTLQAQPQDATGYALQLIQFVGPIKDAWLDEVRATGAEPVHYIAHNGYLVWADASARRDLEELAAEGEMMQYSGPYLPGDKLAPALRAPLANGRSEVTAVPLVIQMLNHPDQGRTQRIIKETALAIESDWEPVMAFQNLYATVAQRDIARLAALPDVVWLNLRLPRELNDEVQAQILAGSRDAGGTMPGAPGYLAWLAGRGFSTDPADYPIVDIVDDGVGNGTVNSGDPTLHVGGSGAQPSRLAYVSNCTSASDGSGEGGHGHINASIAGGFDNRSGSPFRDANGYQRGLGVNPFGRFASTRIFTAAGFELSGCEGTDQGLLQHSYALGARIASNSWGCSLCAGTYDDSAQAFDVGVRDADLTLPGNQALSIVFAAGNDGPDNETVGSPGNAKNVVTVGASENVRPTWWDGCNVGPSEANDLNDIVSFSSRGPAPGQRNKPDVVAPGTHVQGTASTAANYVGNVVCDRYQPANQTVFAASSGTSHSTPAVAGALSLVTYWLQQQFSIADPSPALLKAYLLAHTTYLDGVASGDTLPSNSQGYGLPDLGAAFDDTPRLLADQTTRVFGATGETWALTASVADASKPLRIVLAYTDQAGMVGTSPQVNDVSLTAVVNGQTYRGNQFSGAWSTTGGTADGSNNVEAIYLPPGTNGPISIVVTAANIAGDGVPGNGDATDQDFALVCSNCQQAPDFALEVEPQSQAVCAPDGTSFAVTAVGWLGYGEAVTLSVEGLPTGVTAVFDPAVVIPTGASSLQIQTSSAVTPDTVLLAIRGTTSDRVRNAQADLALSTAVPDGPQPLSPANGAQDQPLNVVLNWTAVAQAGGYDLQIATDAGFTEQVAEASGLETAEYRLTLPVSGIPYFWRVRATNACGSSAWSPAATFETAPLPGDCRAAETRQVLYGESFESGLSGWTHGGANDTWQRSDGRSQSGSWSLHAADLASLSDQLLTSPAIVLPDDASSAALSFWNYQDIEGDYESDMRCYDAAVLEVSYNGGPFRQIEDAALLTDGYDLLVSNRFENALAGKWAWCGQQEDWTQSIVDLSPYMGGRVRLRFRLATDTSVGREGWYVDDVSVSVCEDTPPIGRGFSAFVPLSTRP